MTRAQDRARQAYADQLAGEQPWRCAECGTPVRKGMGDPCQCVPRGSMKEQADQPGEVHDDEEEASAEVFQIAVEGEALSWVEANWKKMDFDYDPTQTHGNMSVIWPLEPGDNDRLAQELEAKGIAYIMVEVC